MAAAAECRGQAGAMVDIFRFPTDIVLLLVLTARICARRWTLGWQGSD